MARITYRPIQPAELLGELSLDGTHIIVAATGEGWSLQQAAAKIDTLTPCFGDTEPKGLLRTPLSWPACVQLAFEFGPHWHPGPRLSAWIQHEVMRRTTYATQPTRYQLPPGLALKPWQPEAVAMVAHLGCLLEDAPRLGKTISTVVGLAERALWGHRVWPVVVVCPKSVVTAWVRAFQLWAPHLRTTAWRGSTSKYLTAAENRARLIGHFDVYVASYGTATVDAGAGLPMHKTPLLRVVAPTLVIDEYHWAKNPDAKRTRAVQRLGRVAAKHGGVTIPLSGTPFTHNYADTQPTMEIFEPGAFPSGERQRERYCVEIAGDYATRVVGLKPEREPELRTCFLGRQIRRSREDVYPGIEKTWDTRVIEIPDPFRGFYDQMETRMLAELDNGDEMNAMSVLTKMMRLQQLSAAACDVENETYYDKETGEEKTRQHVTPRLPSWKIDAMMDVLSELEWPAIAFGMSKPLMELAGQEAEKEGARVGYVVGGQSQGVRDRNVDAFQAGKLDLLCVTIDAGGTGLTLDTAGTSIFLQRHPSFVQSIQAEDRGVMPGKPKALDVVDIFAENTIDLRIREILHGKAVQLAEYFRDPRIVRQLFGGTLRPKREKKSA